MLWHGALRQRAQTMPQDAQLQQLLLSTVRVRCEAFRSLTRPVPPFQRCSREKQLTNRGRASCWPTKCEKAGVDN